MKDEIKGALSCFLPIVAFLICEMLYDYKYFTKKPFYIGSQYLFMIFLGLMVYLYIRYTTLIDIHSNVKIDENKNTAQYNKDIVKKTQDMLGMGIGLFVVVLFSCVYYSKKTNNKIKGIMIFFIYSLITLATMAFKFEQIKYFKESINESPNGKSSRFTKVISFMDYFTKGLNDKKKYEEPDLSVIIPSLVFGLVFGFIDNAGLISGLEALDTPFAVISKLFVGSSPSNNDAISLKRYKEKLEGTTSGLGNLFSDGLGVTLGAFFGNLASRLFPPKIRPPIWIDMVGISLGCILGILIPITFKNVVSGEIIRHGIFSFTFIKDMIILLILMGAFISTCILIPKKASEDIEGEITYDI